MLRRTDEASKFSPQETRHQHAHTPRATQQQCVKAAAVTTAVKVGRLKLKKPK